MLFLKRTHKTIIAAVFAILVLCGGAEAQFVGVGDGLDVIMSPERPRDREQVTITLANYNTDLNRAVITWTLNGKAALKGVGEKNFTFVTGKLGTKTTVSATIQTLQGATFSRTIELHPAAVSLMWEAESYTPPFYKGKALYPYEGTVRVIALPEFINTDGTKINPANLVYTWKEKDSVASEFSGYGKNVFVFQGSIPLRPNLITVEVSNVDKSMIAVSSIEIEPVSPEIVFYKETPLEGILFNKALDPRSELAEAEVKVTAVPYFFDAPSRFASHIKYSWTMNGFPIENFTSRALTLKQGLLAGESRIGLEVRSEARMFQFASDEIGVTFGYKNVNF